MQLLSLKRFLIFENEKTFQNYFHITITMSNIYSFIFIN